MVRTPSIMRFTAFYILFSVTFLAVCFAQTQTAQADEQHAIAMHSEPKYGPDFIHFDYVNPDAPRGGTLRLSGGETFDSFNPYIPKGVAADGIGLTSMTLMEKSADEPFSLYGAIAKSIDTPEDRSWVIFNMRETVLWHDGEPVTANDVVWSFETLTTKGNPFYRAYFANVKDVTALSDYSVKFTFDMANNRELPLIVGDMPILPEHYWTAEGNDFTATTMTPPPGNGPYKVGKVTPGRSIEYIRVEDWWGDDVPAFAGRYNFDRIVYEYYRDQNVSLEAFFAGNFDLRKEYTAKLWATGYDAQPVKDGRIIKQTIKNKLPQGMQAFTMNIRRPVFQDIAVRKAMNYAFDFEWSNKQFAYDAYTRSCSYFENSDMAATGLPSAAELEILEPYKDQLPASVFTDAFKCPKTDGSGNNRANLRTAIKLLDDAGYKMGEDKIRINPKTGEKLEIEFLVSNINGAFERWFQPYKQNLARIGIKADIRIVDASQYVNRILAFDYDLIVGSWGQSNSPGNEQREYWGSEKADATGSRNYIGIKDPVVDALIDMIVKAPTRDDLVIRTRALDRVLLSGWYIIPNWHIPAWRVAHWDKFGKPAQQAPYALGAIDTWWIKEK